MGVLKKNSADPLRNREQKHVVAERGRPIGHSQTHAFARHHSAAANQEERRGGCEPSETLQPKSPLCGTACACSESTGEIRAGRLVYPPDRTFWRGFRRTLATWIGCFGSAGRRDRARSWTYWRFARRTGCWRRCALRAGKCRTFPSATFDNRPACRPRPSLSCCSGQDRKVVRRSLHTFRS